LSDFITYYLFAISCSWGISTRPGIRVTDEFFSFPFAEAETSVKNELISLVDEFIQPLKNNYSKDIHTESSLIRRDVLTKINELINSIYQIRGYEFDLIDYVFNVSRYQFQEGKQHFVSNFTVLDETHYRHMKFVMNRYADVFIKEFEKIYTDEYLQIEVYSLHNFVAMNFTFLKEKPNNKPQVDLKPESTDIRDLFKVISGLSVSKIASSMNPEHNLFIQKDIKGFEENSFYIIKPTEYKCWHRAMAWYDVAEIKEDIEQAELTYLKERKNA
jgi:hypothetical protein